MKCVVVLGVARSGTSMAAGLLTLLGVEMNYSGGVSNEAPMGTFEDREIVAVAHEYREAIENGRPVDALEEQAKNIIRQREARGIPLWGWKSPATIHCMDMFCRHITSSLYIVYVFRNVPEHAMAYYIHKKRSISYKQAMRSVVYSLREMVDVMYRYDAPSCIVEYEELSTHPEVPLRRMANLIGVPVDASTEQHIPSVVKPDHTSWDRAKRILTV